MKLDRHAMYTAIFAALPLPLRGDILGISGLKYFLGSPNYTPPMLIISPDAHVHEADYPDVHICALPFPENSFDYVIADQVLEHVEGDPQVAFDEMHRVLKPGGIIIATSVFMYRKHWGPKDLWRFSPDGLRYLARNFSTLITADGWGNKWLHIAMMLYPATVDLVVPDNKKWSLLKKFIAYNDPNYPFTTWVIAKK